MTNIFSHFSKVKSRDIGAKKWSFLGFFVKIDGSKHMIFKILTLKNMPYSRDFTKICDFWSILSIVAENEKYRFFSIFLIDLDRQIWRTRIFQFGKYPHEILKRFYLNFSPWIVPLNIWITLLICFFELKITKISPSKIMKSL